MTIVSEWLAKATEKLETAGVGTARLDAVVLLEDVTGKERGWLLAHPEFELGAAQVKKLDGFVRRRAEHEPLAYIRNKTEFYGRQFYIDHRVLEPRPESETMIDLFKILKLPENVAIIDIGTGSGALAITAKLESPDLSVIATDIDKNCLDVAQKNAEDHQADIKFVQGDLLKPLTGSAKQNFVLLCNLPYVPDNFQINPAAMREPRIAIFGGKDGLDLYRKLFKQVQSLGQKPQFILTESMPPQHDALAQVAKGAGFKLLKSSDFIQVFAPVVPD